MAVEISIKVTVPEVVLESASVRDAIIRKMHSHTAPDLKRMFNQTVNGWKEKPNFLQKFQNSPAEVSTQVWPGKNSKGGRTYILVNEGAGPHLIRPRKAGMLRFQTGYRPGTRPRVLNSRSSSRFGNVVSARAVNHPGFEPRDFDSEIAEQYGPRFASDMSDAIGVAVQRSN